MSQTASSRVVGTLSIGEVLSLLKREFPEITISKIRFLEAEGLIAPERTASGYRRFAERDVLQLRSVLTMQRDQYLPLKVIREQLEDGADESAPVAGTGLRPDDFRPGAGRVRLTRAELAGQVGLAEQGIAQLESQGLVWASPAGHYDEDALAIATVIGRLAGFGVEPRHLRAFRVVADRDSGLIEQIANPYARPRDPDGSSCTQLCCEQNWFAGARGRGYPCSVQSLDVVGVRMEMPSNNPIVLLREKDGERYLPIWVGAVEATAIAYAQQGVVPPRPLTHDLLRDVLSAVGAPLAEVRITALRDGVFYALLVFESGIEVSARPSDAIALALRTDVPIFGAEEVLDEAGIELPGEEPQEQEVEKFREFLDQISPEDFQ